MNEITTQEPISTTPDSELSRWRWLVDPVPRRWLLPLTGLWIIGLDWLLFSQNSLVLGLATPLLAVIGFITGGLGTLYIQRRYAGDQGALGWLKAMAAGLVVGVPFPLAGSLVGGWILVASGLGSWRNRLKEGISRT